MSETIRQNNLFAAQDWKVVYNAFRNVNLQAYDYQSIYQSLVEYLRTNNPEEFNDYIRNSEMLAHINMMAYLGQSFAFRIDLNARENFFDTAERRESVIKLADALSYKSKRNRAANGLCKITAVKTTEDIADSNGSSLANKTIMWNQPSEPNWYDNFIKILNGAFSSTNTFGLPLKKETVSSIPTEVYPVERHPNANITFKFSETINGTSYNFETVSSNINDTSIIENKPNVDGSFNLLYRNDGNGNTSKDAGFFVQFKQGTLEYRDYQYNTPQVDRTAEINQNNINETDVWVQEIDDNGSIVQSWDEVPSMVGQNIVYNDMFLDNRTIYVVNTSTNNQINVVFSDGNFGEIPVGTYRIWFRTSANESYIIRPNDIFNKTVTIPYVGNDNQTYQLTLTFSLLDTVENADSEETIEEIKKNAPLVHYTQDRMINGEDYNVYPITQTSVIHKIKTVNRTHAGHSRYIDITDPTGSHSNVSVIGEDGYIYNEYDPMRDRVKILDNTNFDTLFYQNFEPYITNTNFIDFYNYTFRREIEGDNEQPNLEYDIFPNIQWVTLPENNYGLTGYFSQRTYNEDLDEYEYNSMVIGQNADIVESKFLRENTKILFKSQDTEDEIWTTIVSVSNNGLVNREINTTGSVVLSEKIERGMYVSRVIPGVKEIFSTNERNMFISELEDFRSFGIRYDFINNKFKLIPQDNIADTDDSFDLKEPDGPTDQDNRWIFKGIVKNTPNGKSYEITSRGLRYVFGSNKQVRFFFKNSNYLIDNETGEPVIDFIKILKSNLNHSPEDINNNKDLLIASRIYEETKTVTFNDYTVERPSITTPVNNEVIKMGKDTVYTFTSSDFSVKGNTDE